MITTHERGADAERCPAIAPPGLDRDDLPGGHRGGLAAQGEDGQLPVLDDVPRGGVGRGAHDDPARLGCRLQAGSDVDRVAGHEEFALLSGSGEVDEHLPGLDADAQAEFRSDGGRGADMDHGRLHLQCRPSRPLGIVLVRGRDTEDRQQRVARALLHHALVACHLLREALERGGHQRGDDLRVVGFAEARESDEIREEERGHLALSNRQARCGGPERACGEELAEAGVRVERHADSEATGGAESRVGVQCSAACPAAHGRMLRAAPHVGYRPMTSGSGRLQGCNEARAELRDVASVQQRNDSALRLVALWVERYR